MKIAHTRSMVRAALEGKLASVAVAPDPNFGVLVPENCPDVPADVLWPENAWADKAAYAQTAQKLRGLFEENYRKFE